MPRPPLLERVLGGAGPRRFAAIAGPNGVHVIEYARGRQGTEIVAGIRQGAPGSEPETLADALADAIEAMGGRGGDLSVGLSGFGTAHHILTLPEADEEILRPIARRELLRYYPDLDDPIIDFTPGAEAEGAPTKRELLVAAAPRRVVSTLHEGLRTRGIRLRHLTILPRVLQTVYEAFDGDDGAAVLLLLLESGPLIGCFHRGWLRLFIEPPFDVHGRPLREPAAVSEQVERATLFLRQQFPNVAVNRVLLAAPSGEYPAIQAALEATSGSHVHRLADAPAGSLAALGTALDTHAARSLELLPRELRPRSASDRWARVLGGAAAAVIAAAALWWTGATLFVARAEAARAQNLEARVESRLPWLMQAEAVLESRQGHRQRLEFLERTGESRAEARRVLAAVAGAAGPGVRLESLRLEQEGDGWRLTLAGVSTASSSAAAVRAVDTLYRGIPDRLPVTEVELGELEGAIDDGDAGVAIAFDMSFIVQWERDLQR